MSILQWKPLYHNELQSLSDLFERSFRQQMQEHNLPTLPVNAWQDEENLYIEAYLPGFTKEEIQVDVEGDQLHLRAHHQSESDETQEREYLLNEWHKQNRTVERSLKLPYLIEHQAIKAKFEKSELLLTLPKVQKTKKNTILIE